MRSRCNVVFDSDALPITREQIIDNQKPSASFAGFLDQSEISKAYVAADVLVLPSDYSETWGLVVNEAMASGLPSVVSDRCGCALDLATVRPNVTFPAGQVAELAVRLECVHGGFPGQHLRDSPVVRSDDWNRGAFVGMSLQ